MTHRCLAVSVLLAIVVSLLLAPVVAISGGPGVRPIVGRGGQGRASGVHQGVGIQLGAAGHQGPRVRHDGGVELIAPPVQPAAPRNVVSRPFARSVGTPGVTVSSWVYASPVVYAAPPAYDPPPPVYAPPPVSYSAPVENVIVFAPSPESAPMPTVVEFSTGRYELRGDGIETAYVWVWIPNPPSAPPTAPPPLVPMAEAPPRAGLQPLYRWIDEAGVTHWTHRREVVPEQHLAEAELPRVP
jgi:hypothetical protein